MDSHLSQKDKIRRGSEDSWKYFRYMTDFVGFTAEDAATIRESGLIIEKYIPTIVADFYSHLLSYPPTRKFFLTPDGTIDQEYLQKRMLHLTNFWRRTASGVYDEDYARYVDYVGHAHTARGADPGIYIAERYVIGQAGFMQHAISKAIEKELHGIDEELEHRAVRAWNLLMMVILEMLSRAYGTEHDAESEQQSFNVDHEAVHDLAVETYEKGLGLERPRPMIEMRVGRVEDIPEGERKIVEVEGRSIGVFHHQGQWYALVNHCLHRGGPVATGTLEGNVLTCPWHGFQYDVTTGKMVVDPDSKLEMFQVILRDGEVFISVMQRPPETTQRNFDRVTEPAAEAAVQLAENEFPAAELHPGQTRLVRVDGAPVAVYNAGGELYATHNICTHAGGPLNEGKLAGSTIICPWHGSCFDVRTGEVQCGPAQQPVDTYSVQVEDGIARVERSA